MIFTSSFAPALRPAIQLTSLPKPDTLHHMSKINTWSRLQHHLAKHPYLVADSTKRSRTLIIMPGFSLDAAELRKLKGAEYYEERMLYMMGYLQDANTSVIYVTSRQIDPAIIEYYLDLLSHSKAERDSMLKRWHPVYVGNAKTHRTLTQKVLHSQRLRQQILRHVANVETAVIRCFNVSSDEQALAVKLNIPLFAPDPTVLDRGFKSGSRKIFKAADLHLPFGFEDITSLPQLIQAIAKIKKHDRAISKVVLKFNHSFSGVGNATLNLEHWPRSFSAAMKYLKRNLQPNEPSETVGHYLSTFCAYGGIVEEWMTGTQVLSPSAQVIIAPDGEIEVVSTHEQVFDEKTKQIYLGASFPAGTAVRTEVMHQASRIAQVMTAEGIIGPLGIDFVAVERAHRWRVYPVEINLRKGGTTHPFRMVQLLTHSRLAKDGKLYDPKQQPLYYYAYDNIVSGNYKHIRPEELIQLVRQSGLAFDHDNNTGVSLHLLGPLYKYGKFGAVCIAHTPKAAEQLFLVLRRAVDEYAEQEVEAAQLPTVASASIAQTRLVKTFMDLVKIPSPSQQEAAVALQAREWLVQAGAKVRMDQRGNLIAKVDGTNSAADPILLSAHLDTVQPGTGIQPVVRGDVIMSSGDTILGADDKLGVVYIIELLRMIQEYDLPHRPLEIIFSVCEEQFAQGVAALDFSKIQAPVAIVLDGAALGEIDTRTPYIADVNVKIIGKEAHSGIASEHGINAIKIAAQAIHQMKLGKIDVDTTANIGTIHGGNNRNVVPGLVELVGEVRSFSKKRLEEQLERMHKALRDATERFSGFLTYDSKLVLEGYEISVDNKYIQQLMQTMKRVKMKPQLRQTYGGSDASIFMAHGIMALDVGIGVHHPHTNDEHVYIADMVKMVELLIELVKV